MSSIAIPVPSALPAKRRIPWLLAVFIALGVVAVAWIVLAISGRGGDGYAAGEFFTAQPIDLDVTITKDGELQAVSNVEIVCKVDGQSVILDIAKEGAYVHKGDVVVKLDPSVIEQ